MLKHQYINQEDMHSYLITDSIDEAVEYIKNSRFDSNNIELKRANDEK